MIQLGRSQVLVTIGWNDPARLKLRETMLRDAHDIFTRFQTRTKLKVKQTFELEDLAEFIINDQVTKPIKVVIADITNGSGVEIDRSFTPVEAILSTTVDESEG